MNKKDTAEHLNVSTRLVEKYASEGRLGEVKYIRGRTGKQADYDQAAVEQLKRELEMPDHQLVPAQSNAAGLIAPQDRERFIAALEAIASREQTRAGLVAASPSPVALESKLMLSLPEAAAVSGIPVATLRIAARDKKLKTVENIGGGYGKVKRSDLDAYIKRL